MRLGTCKLRVGGFSPSEREWCLFFIWPALILLLAVSGCAQPGDSPTPQEQVARRFLPVLPPSGAPGQNPARSAGDTWVARGRSDACGNPWVLEITRKGKWVDGVFWRGAIKYDIAGNLQPVGNMERAVAIKNRFFEHRIGPRFMEFNVIFGEGEARGEHYFANGRCLTPFRLTPATN